MTYSAIPFDRPTHAAALRRLWGANFSADGIDRVLEARERWLYDECPAGAPETAIGQLDATGEVIGCASILPWPRSLPGGATLRAGVMIDFGVEHEHRTSGPAVALQRRLAQAARPRGFDLLFGYPNERSAGVFLRVGFKRVAEAETWVFPLRIAAYLERALAKLPQLDRVPISRGTLARLAAPIAGPIFHALLRARTLLDAGHEVEELERADARFDALHDEARARFELLGDHSSTYLNWRYGDFKTARYHFFALRERGTGRLDAYAVWARVGDDVVIADVLARAPDDPAIDALLLRLALARYGDGARRMVLSYVGTPRFTARLPRLFFRRAPASRRALLAYVPPDAPDEARARALRPDAWFLFDGELDI